MEVIIQSQQPLPVWDNNSRAMHHHTVIKKALEILRPQNEAKILDIFDLTDRISQLSKSDINHPSPLSSTKLKISEKDLFPSDVLPKPNACPSLEIRKIKDEFLLKNSLSLISSMNKIKLCFENLRLGIIKEYEFLCEGASMPSFEEPLKAYHVFYNLTSSPEIKKTKDLCGQLVKEAEERTDGVEDIMPDEDLLLSLSKCYGISKEEMRAELKDFYSTTNKIRALPTLLENAKADMNTAINNFKKKYCFWAHHCAARINPSNWGYSLSKQKFYRLYEWGFYDYIGNPLKFEDGFLMKLNSRPGENLPEGNVTDGDSFESSDACDCLHFRRSASDTEFHFPDVKDEI